MVANTSATNHSVAHEFIINRATAFIFAASSLYHVSLFLVTSNSKSPIPRKIIDRWFNKTFIMLASFGVLLILCCDIGQLLLGRAEPLLQSGFLQFLFAVTSLDYAVMSFLTIWGV